MNNSTFNRSTFDGRPSGTIYNGQSSDQNCLLRVSDYKWLTNTLKTAQTNQAVQPYYTCQVIDDSLVSNQILTSPLQPIQGSVCSAPDGSLLAVGLDLSNNVGFWKISDGSQSSNWSAAPSSILENISANRGSTNHYSISCSDYIQGTYTIDIYFFGNYTGTYLTIRHYYSNNGGNTWTLDTSMSPTLIPVAQQTFISAGKPYQDNFNNIINTCFYINTGTITNTRDISYQQGTNNSNWSGENHWSVKNINTEDWILHSLDSSYINGNFYIAFSGYHSTYESNNSNYNIYLTKILSIGNSTTDIWSYPTLVIGSSSSSLQNINKFTLPSLTYDNGTLYIMFSGSTIDSIQNSVPNQSTTGNVTTLNIFYLGYSTDFKNFNYPLQISDQSNNQFQDSNYNSFVRQNNYFYIAGNGQLWQFIKNNTVADVSNDILSYTLNDTQLSPSTVTLNIGNQNNQWLGASPTSPGYQALAKGKKINIMQGYYTSQSIKEVAPKNIYYIDDIQLNVSSSSNDFNISGRDFYRKLKSITTKYDYTFTGIKKYVDVFDGSTFSNYSSTVGNWLISGNQLQNDGTQTSSQASTILFNLYKSTLSNYMMMTNINFVGSIAGGTTYIYLNYIDSLNYTVAQFQAGTTTISVGIFNVVNGSIVQTVSGGTFIKGSTYATYPILIIKHDYYTYDVYVGNNDINNGNGLNSFISGGVVGGTINISNYTNTPGYVGFGGYSMVNAISNFRYLEFDNTQSIEELIKIIGNKSGISDYKMPKIFSDYFYNSSNYIGTFGIKNRNLILTPSQQCYKQDLGVQNGEIVFNAILTPSVNTSNYSFDFNFNSNYYIVGSDTNKYTLRIGNDYGTKGYSFPYVRLYSEVSGVSYQMTGTEIYSSGFNNLEIDFTKLHEYKVLFFNRYIFLAVDGQIILGFYDNNITQVNNDYYSYLGFATASNSTLSVSSIVGNALYNQVDTFTINPGDDLESAIEGTLGIVRAYMFSDNMGRCKIKLLSSSDTSTYTYNESIINQTVDNSAKEFINQVTVNGQGVTATVRDAISIALNNVVKEEIINDTKITTYNDALIRANAELMSFNKYNNQYNPKQILNVGSELYDVIHITNTGNNSTNINQDVRIYSQEMDVGGDSISYYLLVETGTK